MKKLFLLSAMAVATCVSVSADPVTEIGRRLSAAPVISEICSDTVITVCPGVTETDLHAVKSDGSPLRLFIIEADLNQPGLSMEVATPGDSCVASGFNRQTLSEMAAATDRPGHRVMAMVNADFWDVQTMDVRGPLHRRGNVIQNHFVYNPHLWQQALSFVGVFDNGDVTIADTIAYHGAEERLREATGAGLILLKEESVQPLPEKYCDPRTFFGYTSKGKVYMITADGRAAGYSMGLTYPEMGDIMKAIGCMRAVNLDGGGSSQMLVRQPDGSLMIRNRPSDGKERPVINGWMIVVDAD